MTKVVHAEWEQGEYLDWGDMCSNCWYDSGIEPCYLEKCPNCGAIMDGKRNNRRADDVHRSV